MRFAKIRRSQKNKHSKSNIRFSYPGIYRYSRTARCKIKAESRQEENCIDS